jgi:hypothetical protein
LTPDAKKIGYLFWDDYTHKRPYTKESLKRLLLDAGFKNFKIFYEYKWFRGLGWSVRKGIISPKNAIRILKFLLKIGITHKGIFAECRK